MFGFGKKEEPRGWDNPCDAVVERLAGSGSYVGEDAHYTYVRYGDRVFKLSSGRSIPTAMGSIETVPLSHCAVAAFDGFSLKDADNVEWETVWSRRGPSPKAVREFSRLMDGRRERSWEKMLDEARGWS